MKTTKYIFTLVIALSCAVGNLFAVEKSYYSSLDGKSGTALREALTNIVYTHHTTDVGYNWTFDGIDIVNGEILDIYSTCAWTSSQQGKSYSGICDGYNREHVVPQSLFNSAAPQKTDRHHLFLTDGQVNNQRSSYPFGETNVTTAFSGYSNGNKALGKLGASSSGFSGTVYEPDDEYKGDIARAIMYMAIRYATADVCKKYGGTANSYPVTSWSNAMFSGSLSTNYGLSANAVAMYMKWHRDDPPSAKEIARNNGVETKQGNRNPFVDLPDLAEYLWGTHKTDAVNLSSLELSTGGGAVATPYEITLNRNGSSQTLTCTGTYTLPTAGEETAACAGWPFVGWTTSSSVSGTSAPTYTTQTTGATTLYAVYANTSAASAPKPQKAGSTTYYEKVQSDGDLILGEYLIVCENSSVAFDGSLHTLDANNNKIDVSIVDETIAANSTTEASEFVIDPIEGTIRSKSGYFIGATTNANSLLTNYSSPYENTISIDDSENAVIKGSGGAYLRYNNNTSNLRFRYFRSSTYTSQQTIQLYRKTTSESSTTTYMTSPTCGDPHTITLSSGGNVTGGEFEASASSAYAGATITLLAEPSAGYTLDSWSVTKQGGGSVTVTDNQFTMPDANVTVSATFTALPTYNIRFYNNGTQVGSTQSVYLGGYPDIPSNPTACEGYDFVGWYTESLGSTNTTSHTWVEDFTVSGAQDYYAVFSKTETSGGSSTKIDELDLNFTGRPASSTYGNWSGKTGASGAVYAGNSAGDYSSIQLRSSSQSGIITTESGGKATYVTVEWNSHTTDNRVIDIYGKNSAYSNVSELYVNTTDQGTYIGSIPYDGTITSASLEIEGDYEYIGIRSHSNAVYLNSVSITWSSGSSGSSTTYYTSTTTCTPPCEGQLATPVVTATPGNEKITLTWADVTDADHYTVTIGQGAGYTTECGSAASIGEITNSAGVNTCIITGLTNGLEYTTDVVANGTTVCDSEADEDQATPMDCTPWDDPTLNYNSYALTVGSAHATLTISGTQHGAPTFSSSNVSVLTVDENGEVTPVGAGTATITAHWDLTDDYCEKEVVSSLFTVSGPLTITFNANDGTVEPVTKTQTVTYNVAATLDANTFTRTGYTFQGWATTADGAKVHNDGASVTFLESTTLYAVWQINSHNVTFTPSPTGATVTVNSQSTSPQSAEYGSTVTIAVTPATHYTLYSIEVSNGASVTIKNNTGTFIMPDENVTVTVTLTEEAKSVINWYVNGTPTAEEKYAGETLAGIAAPDGDAVCDGKTFVGWTATANYSNETTAPTDLFTDPTTLTMPAGGANYYAVFAETETSGGSASLTKLGSSSTFETGDNIVIVAKGTSYALYQETVSSSYVKNWIFDNSVATVGGNEKNYLTLSKTGDEWYLGDDTNDYLYTSGSNNLAVSSTKTKWMIAWNSAESAFTIVGNSRYLSCRTDLTSDNKNLYRMGGTGTSTGVAFFDIYRYVAGSGSGTTYSNYSTTCVACTNKVTLTKGVESNGTFALNKANGEYNNCDADFVVTVSDITPAAGYYCTGVTATGDYVTVSGPDGSGNYTVTYTHGYSITSTITANFAASPTYTATFMNGSAVYGSAQTTYAGNNITAPAGTPEACEGYTFVGWVAAAQTSETTVLPETVTFPQPMPVGGITYYALYRRIEGGSGSTNVVLNPSAQYTNGQEAGSKEIDGVTFAFAIGGNSSNAPKYYSSGTSVRMYSDNTLTISSASAITAIEFTWGDTHNAGLDASEGEYNSNNSGGSWSGSTTSITFEAGASGQQHIQTITVTIDGGGTPYYTTAPSCSGYTITVVEVSQGEGVSDKKRCDEGGTVTITLTPGEGYECGGITTEPSVTPSGSGCTYTFTMPASDITVTPVFTPKTPRTFTFVPGTGICATTELSEGVWNTGVTLPTATANSGCDPEYVFAGWATAPVSFETDVRPTLYKAGETYNGEDLTLYAVYAQTTAGSSSGFTLSYTYNEVTYYVTARSGSNSYMGASTDVAEAARFSIVTSNEKQYLCWHGTEDTYIYTGTGNKTDLSFTTDITSAANGWDVTETDATLKLQSNGNDRYFMFNTNQKDRYAAYAVEGELIKGEAGTTVYNSFPSCVCTSIDITYNANGGTLADGCSNVTGGDCERDWKLCDAPTREDYIFSGWKDQAGTLYSAGATVTDLKISLTLTAQWIPAPYTVLFDAGTGTSVESLTEESRGDGIMLPKAEPSAACADDWTFIGWSETKITSEASTATIIGVSGVNYIPTANNTTLYAVYRKVDTDGATSDYTRVSDDTPLEGDYAIVVARTESSFGLLTYGTINKGRLIYSEAYTELPDAISSPSATQIWHLTYDADGYAYLYNANSGAYLAASGYNVDYNANAGSAFLFTRDPGTYGDYKCLNNTASSSDNYYLGANKDANYIRYYSSSALVSLYGVTLYQGSAGTRYYSTEPECTPCEDPEWSFQFGTSVVKTKGSAPFTNTVLKGHESAGTVTYSSTNEAVATVNNTGLVTLVGTGSTTITLRLTRAMPYCAAVLQYELEVKDPSIEISGVTIDGEMVLEHDLDGEIVIDLSEGHSISTGTAANDLFFSKYFEAASNMKLFAIFNGTGHEVDIAHIRVRCNCTNNHSVWPTKTGDLGYVELSNVSKLRELYPNMKIPSGTELVFWSNNKGSTTSTQTYNTYLRDCISITVGDMTYHYSDMEAGEIPNWFCLGSYTDYNTKDADGNNQFIFNGDDSMILERYDEATGTWVAIDLFGAGTSEAPASTEGLVEQITDEYEINGVTQALNDGAGFHAECAGNPIPLSTNRYMLIRKNTVLDGLTAVTSNTTSFATLCSEWDGTPVGGATGSTADSYCNSGEKFSDIGEYDYAENYIEWVEFTDGSYQITENADGTVSVTFNNEDLFDRACQLLKIEVHNNINPSHILASTEYKIPIVVKAGEVLTSADLFHEQGDKCATCDVAILGNAILTKAGDGTTNDMPAVRDIYVYGGGQLVIPEGTHYTAHDLILRTQVADDKINMNVPNVNVHGSLINQYGGSIRQQTRVGTSRFYQFAVPYTVRLEDVTFSDGTPAVYGEDFMIRYYDGEQRAINLGTVSNWRNYEGTELYPGVGYTLAVAKKAGHEQRELIFPMANASLVEGEPATKATTIHAWGDNTIRANHRGWNFLSNPYLTTYGQDNLYEDAGSMLTTGQLVPDPEHPGWWVNNEGTVPYVTIINSARTDYTQELVSLQDLPPFTTFFIQAGDDSHNNGDEFALTFDRTHRKSAAPSYVRAEQKPSVARFGVLLSGNDTQDNCGVVVGENYSAAYDMQADLSKEFGSAYSLKLYTLQEDEMRMAFLATHTDSLSKPIPVGVRLPANAEYTFSIDRRYHLGAFRHIYLIDNLTGTHTDLLTDTYSFTGTKQQNDARFSLNVIMPQNVPTDIHNLLNGIYVAGSTRAFLLSGLPQEADIYVYDMSGHLVATQHTRGVSSVSFAVPDGVYQIRVVAEGANALLRTIVY